MHPGKVGQRHGMMIDMGRCCGHGQGMMQGHGPSHCARSFFTKEEIVEMLGMYKEHLEKEAEGVQEHLDKLNEE